MKCPGQDTRYWHADAAFETECPQCGHLVEFFKDESTRRCGKCGTRIVNPRMDFGCASYCRFAEQCLGDLPPELMAKREDLLKDRAAIEMKRRLGRDFRRIAHTVKAARYAERIAGIENGDPAVVLLAAYLHDIEKDKSAAVSTARDILSNLGARKDLVDEVCGLIASLAAPGGEKALNSQCFHDACHMAQFEQEWKEGRVSREDADRWIADNLLTQAGVDAARDLIVEDG